MDESIDELLDALSDSGIADEDEGSLLDDLGPCPSPSHHHDETITTNCTTLLADVSDSSPSSTTTFATHSIDALVAKAGPPPLAPLPFRSHAAAPTNHHLVDVDYCRIQVECITLSNETPQISSRCHAMLKNVGKDAQLCLRYELPPLTSNPEVAAGGAEAIVVGDDDDDDDEDGKSQVVITIGDVLSIYPLPNEPTPAAPAKTCIAKSGRATTNRRRIKSKSKIAKPSSTSIKTAKAVLGATREIQLNHSNLLAIAFVTDKDVASWSGTFTIDLVCTDTGNADPVRLASCKFLLDDVLSSRTLDVRMQLDLIADKVSSSFSSSAVGSLVARITLIGGNSFAEEEEDHQHVSASTNTRLPITDSPHRSDQPASPAITSAEDQPKEFFESSRVQTHAAQQQHKNLMPLDHETQPDQIESKLPTTVFPPPLNLPPASLPAPAPNHRRLDYQPTLHPSDVRMALERQLSREKAAAHRIQTCIRKHLVQQRRQRRKEEEHIALADLDVDSPPPPPPPPTSSSSSPSASPFSPPQQSGDLSGHGGASCDAGISSEPFCCRPCDVSSLGESSPPTSSTEDIGSGSGTPSAAAEGQLHLGIRLGSCKGLSELVSICHVPGPCLLQPGAVVVVSYTIFKGLDGLEATAYSKALPLHPLSSSFDFDSEQMVAISLSDESTIEYLENESLEMKLWILPASHSSVLPNEAAFDSDKSTNANHLLATANIPLAALLDYSRCAVGGYRQIVPWKPKGWLGEEHIGSLDVAIYRAGVKVDQLQPYSEGLLSIASAVSIPREEAAREDDQSSSSSSASNASPNASSTKEESIRAAPSSVSSSTPDSETSSDSSSSSDTTSISPGTSSNCSGSGDSSSAEEEVPPGDVQSLSVVMESLESVKKSLSYHFDGQSGCVSAHGIQVNGGEDNADISQGRKEQYDHIGSTSNNCSTLVTSDKTSSRGATPSDVKDEDARTTTNFVDVGTSPIDLGADNAIDCSQAAPVVATSSIANEEAASQTDTFDDTPSCRSTAKGCDKSTNTIPMHSPSSSSTCTESSDDGDLNRTQSLANTCSTTNPQIQRDFISSSSSTSTSTFRRRRRLFSSSNEATDRNAVGCTVSSPTTTTSRALSRARIPMEYRRNGFNQLPSSPADSFPTTRSTHLSSASADRISSIMSQYPRRSGNLLGRSLYESSSSSDSCSSSVAEEGDDSSSE